jgi:hypothetical protein
MLTLELGVTHQPTVCSCCGKKSVNLTGFVYSDGNASAVYFAGLAEDHPDRSIQLAVGIGEWGDGTTAADRVGFTMVLRNAASSYEVMLVDPEQSSWNHVTMAGTLLAREPALKHPRVKEVFHITDHLVIEDPRIRAYLNEGVLPVPTETGA